MSLKSSRNIDELEELCQELGIDTWCCAGKTDYIALLRDYYIKQEYPQGKPKWLQIALEMDSPMLCKQYDAVPEKIREKLMDRTDMIVDEKIDGCRMVLVFSMGIDGKVRFSAFGRNNSVKTFLPINYGPKIVLHHDKPLNEIFEKDKCFALDCEIVCTKSDVQVTNKSAKTGTQLQSTSAILASDKDISRKAQETAPFKFVVFDCIYCDGEMQCWRPLRGRRITAQYWVDKLKKCGVNIEMVKSTTGLNKEQKMAWFEDVVANGGEGVVIKDPDSVYEIDGGRHNTWFKMKRTMSQSIGDTIDMFIVSGNAGTEGHARENVIASVDCYAYVDGEPRHLATVSNFTDDERFVMTKYDNGNIILNPDYVGRVIEVDAQDVSSKNMRFMHAKMIKWRPDKTKYDCCISEEDIKRYIL